LQTRHESACEQIGIAQFMLFLSKQLSKAEYEKLVQMEYQYINHVLKKYDKKSLA
jgi:hypothetical protein